MRRSKVKYKAVIFDFDYTLGDCTEGIAASVNHGLKKLGYGGPYKALSRGQAGV